MAKKVAVKKGPSMDNVAKAYRKSTVTSKPVYDGARYFDNKGGNYAIASTTSKNTYKPKATQVTLGGTRKNAGATIKKIGKAKY